MRQRVSYTLLRDWHAAGVAASAMGLLYLAATFPWGRSIYAFIMTNSIPKAIIGIATLFFIITPLLRMPVTALWYLVKPLRDNVVLTKLVCVAGSHNEAEDDIKRLKRNMCVQYLVMAVLLIAIGFAIVFSVYIAMGLHLLVPINYIVLVLGIVIAIKCGSTQLYMRLPRLRTYNTVRWLASMNEQKRRFMK